MPKAREALAQSDIDEAVADERERCAWLCDQLAERWEASAAKLRVDGSFVVRALWPFGEPVTCVKPRWAQAAKDTDAAAHGLRTVARGIRAGWDDPVRAATADQLSDMLSRSWHTLLASEMLEAGVSRAAVQQSESVHGVRFRFADRDKPPHSVSDAAKKLGGQ